MNDWKRVWNKRDSQIGSVDEGDIFGMFCKLKSADGFDTQLKEGYYEALFDGWGRMDAEIQKHCHGIGSVYEVGCGSGANLYLYRKLLGIGRLGGIDYSKPLIEIARQVCVGGGNSVELKIGEAIDIEPLPCYDLVLSDSVFAYFPDVPYGMEVLGRMCGKAGKAVVVRDIFDLAKKDACMEARRASMAGYDEHYKDLDKTFYPREAFLAFARGHGYSCRILEPGNKRYWNNDFVFDFYLYKQ